MTTSPLMGWPMFRSENVSFRDGITLVGGFNPFEKYYIVKMGIFPK